MEKLELTGHIDDNGVLSIHNKVALKEWAIQHPCKNVLVKFQGRGSKRSTRQNSYYHSVVVQMVRQGLRDIGYIMSPEETHFFLKQKFNPVQIPGNGGLVIEVPGTTTQLNKIEFSEYIERISQFAAEYLNVVIPPANADLTMKF
jgi:hypothetical protein